MSAETESPTGADGAVEPVASPTQPADGDRRAVPPRLGWGVKRLAASCFVAGSVEWLPRRRLSRRGARQHPFLPAAHGPVRRHA